MKVGYVAIIGNANVGKSTLVNKFIGAKVSIVSPKKQTTRNNIIGILNKEDSQIVFVDTPGIHTSNNALDKYMMKNVRSAANGVDVIVYMIDAEKKITDDILNYVEKLTADDVPVIVVVSKTDLTTFAKLYPSLDKLNKIQGVKEIVPISALKSRNMDILLEKIKLHLPECETRIFSEDEYTDKSENFIIKEIIREKALYVLDEEIPHGIAVEIIERKDEEKLISINADIICEKQSHKTIIIGKQGGMAREIGSRARVEIEKLLGKKVMLTLYVKVIKNWRTSLKQINEFGYNETEI